MADGTVVIEILGEAEKFNKALADVEKHASRALDTVGGAMASAGAGLTAAVTAPLAAASVAAGKWALDTASAAEQADIAFSTMLGPERAKALIADLADFARTTPFEMEGLTSATQKLLAYGFAADDVIPLLTSVGDATAGLGAGQEGIDAVTRALGQMQAKGKVMSEEMLQLTEVGIPAWQYLADAVSGGDIPAAMEMVTDGAVDARTAIEALQAGMDRDFGGMMEQQASTLQGALSNLTDSVANAVRQVKDTEGWKRAAEAVGDLADSLGPLVEKALPLADEGLRILAGVVEDVAAAIDGMDAGDLEDLLKTVAGAASAGPVLLAAGKGAQALSKGLDVARAAAGAASGPLSRLFEAAKLTAGGAGTLSESLESVGLVASPTGLAVAGLTGIVVAAAAAYADWQRRQETLAEATDGLMDVVGDTAALEGYAGSIEDVGEKSRLAAMDADELAEATSRRVAAMRENTEAAETEIAQLNTAQGIINEYAGKTDLASDAQGRLQWALDLVNDAFGTSITQSDVAAGKYTDQDGAVQDLTTSINGLIEAKKNEARVEAVSANLTEAYGAQADAAETLASSQKLYADSLAAMEPEMAGMEQWQRDQAIAQLRESTGLASAERQYEAATEAVKGYEEQLGDAAAATSDAGDAYDRLSSTMDGGRFELFSAQLESYGTSFGALSEDLRALGADTEAFAGLSEDQLAQIAGSYDGTTASIAGLLRELGVTAGEFTGVLAQAGADVQSTSAVIADAMGLSLGQLEQQLSDAGISAQQLNEIGSANLAALAANCNGSMTQLIWMIQNYNAVPIIDKDGSITVDQTQLMDAEGRVYEWNGQQLVDQDGNVVVDDVQLTDAQGNVVEWNGSELKLLEGAAEVDDSDLRSAMDLVSRWNSSSLKTLTGSATVTTTQRTVNVVETQAAPAAARASALRAASAASTTPAAAALAAAPNLATAAARLAASPAAVPARTALSLARPAAESAAEERRARAAERADAELARSWEDGARRIERKIDEAAERVERAASSPVSLRADRRELGRLIREAQ